MTDPAAGAKGLSFGQSVPPRKDDVRARYGSPRWGSDRLVKGLAFPGFRSLRSLHPGLLSVAPSVLHGRDDPGGCPPKWPVAPRPAIGTMEPLRNVVRHSVAWF